MSKLKESEDREWWEAIWAETARAQASGDKVIDLGDLAESPEGLSLLGLVGALAQFPQNAFERHHIAAAALAGEFQGQWWGQAYAMMAKIQRWRIPQTLQLFIYSKWKMGGKEKHQPDFVDSMDPRILAVGNVAEGHEVDHLLEDLRGSQQIAKARYREVQEVGERLLDADPDLASPQPGRHSGPGLPPWSWSPPRIEAEESAPAPSAAPEFEGSGSFAY